MTPCVKPLCFRDSNPGADKHYPIVWRGPKAVWQRRLFLGYGRDVILKKTDKQNVIQHTNDVGKDVGYCGCATIKPCCKVAKSGCN